MIKRQNDNFELLERSVGADIAVRRGKDIVERLDGFIQKGAKVVI